MYPNFRPVAYFCPWCFSIYLFPESGINLVGADIEFSVKPDEPIFCYGAYPAHSAQKSLSQVIHRCTSGQGLLLAHGVKPDGFALPPGKVYYAPALVPESDLRQLEQRPAETATKLLDCAVKYYEDQDLYMTLGLAERAAVVDPESARAFKYSARVLNELGYVDAAREHYRKSKTLASANRDGTER